MISRNNTQYSGHHTTPSQIHMTVNPRNPFTALKPSWLSEPAPECRGLSKFGHYQHRRQVSHGWPAFAHAGSTWNFMGGPLQYWLPISFPRSVVVSGLTLPQRSSARQEAGTHCPEASPRRQTGHPTHISRRYSTCCGTLSSFARKTRLRVKERTVGSMVSSSFPRQV
jgi:hypothetical protein